MRTAPVRVCFALALLLGIAVSSSADNDGNDHPRGNSKVQTGLSISPVPLNMRGKNRALVGLGSYLVNAGGGCNDCHTAPPYMEGGNPFQGETEVINAANYLAGGQEFGPFVSRNLTPDEFGRPAGLTLEEFVHTMRTGEDHRDDETPILQVMPWPVYRNLSDRDLRAIYEYLSAIPSRPDNY